MITKCPPQLSLKPTKTLFPAKVLHVKAKTLLIVGKATTLPSPTSFEPEKIFGRDLYMPS